MNKAELIHAMAEKASITKKDAGSVVDAFAEIVAEEISKDEKIQLVGFGTFEPVHRAEREGINPQTKEKLTIAASTTVRFKAGKALKDTVNGKN